jgi:predicted SprT family Zn-dependent metalloprotease
MTTAKQPITTVEYNGFQQAFDFFNAQLFAGSLPHVLVTLQRHAKARGYFAPERFHARGGKDRVHEIALNPDTFCDESDERILSTLAHEMAHLWQQAHGTPPRRCYHDREWAAKMREIGLQPTTTGGADGKETGQSVTHFVIKGGPFQRAYNALAKKGIKLHWESPAPMPGEAKRKAESKTKYTCPECGQNAWAKPDAVLICGSCFEDDQDDPQTMLAN